MDERPMTQFEARLERRLRDHAAITVAPVDADAVARSAIASRRQITWATPPWWPVVAATALLLLLLGLLALAVGSRTAPRHLVGDVSQAGTLPVAMNAFGATLLRDGTILVTGEIGVGVAPLHAVVYDPRTRTISAPGPIGIDRGQLVSQTEQRDGSVLVLIRVPGSTTACCASLRAVRYLAASRTFVPATVPAGAARDLPSGSDAGATGAAAVAMPDGRVLLLGTTESVLDPASGRVTTIGTDGRLAFRLWLPDGRALLARHMTTPAGRERDEPWTFDPATGVLAPLGSGAVPGRGGPWVLLPDGRVLAFEDGGVQLCTEFMVLQ